MSYSDEGYVNKMKEQGKYYTGIFSDQHGNPDFKGLGPILKGIFYLFIFTIIMSSNNFYFIIPLLLYFIGKVLIAIRFKYVQTLNPNGHDKFFLDMNVLENNVEGFVALFVVFYLLLHSMFEKKK
jgi:hypothetical protein